MNKDNHIPTDEQLCAWLIGCCDDDERAAVERWLADHPEAMDELLHIAVAAALQERRAADAATPFRWLQQPALWAVAASVVLALVVGAVVLLRPVAPEGPVVAHTVPEAETVVVVDPSVGAESTTADAAVGSPEASVVDRPRSAAADGERGLQVQRAERITADKAVAAMPAVTMVFPRRSREVVSEGVAVTFQWTSDAPLLVLTLVADAPLLRVELPGSGAYTVPSATLVGVQEVCWTLATQDGTVSQMGKIVIMDE